jgi:hypothetical protein
MLKLGAIVAILLPTAAYCEVNETTDEYVRDKYVCEVASRPRLEPDLKGYDFIRADSVNIGYADLTSDGIPEIITGASDETYLTNDDRYFAGNLSRSRHSHQYSFYSTRDDFKAPNGTKFMLARTILTQDFNGDGKDDMVFVQHGPDQEPYEPRRNEILLSDGVGYSVNYLPGPSSLFHGGAAGDIDNDGDVDIVVTPGPNNEVFSYINNGKGSFVIRKLFTGIGRNYNIKLWDFDGDENLDIMIDGQAEPLQIFWGEGNGTFPSHLKVDAVDANDLLMDIAPLSKQEDAKSSVAVLRGLSLGREFAFFGYDITEISFSGRKVEFTRTIDRLEEASWLGWISSCDFSNDGDIDLVSEFFGEPSGFFLSMWTWKYLDKLVWINENGNYARIPLESPIYYGNRPEVQSKLKAFASSIGVSLEHYEAKQVYYPSYGNAAVSRIELTDEFNTPWFMQNAYERAITAFPHSAKNGLTKKGAIGESVAQTPDPNQVSDRVKEILAARKKAKIAP